MVSGYSAVRLTVKSSRSWICLDPARYGASTSTLTFSSAPLASREVRSLTVLSLYSPAISMARTTRRPACVENAPPALNLLS